MGGCGHDGFLLVAAACWLGGLLALAGLRIDDGWGGRCWIM